MCESARRTLLTGLHLAGEQGALLHLEALGGDIAAQLGKSEKTVRNQVSSLLEKTGLSTRSELIVRTLAG